ncbi:hypothetical protein [Larkinella ripae]
MKRIWCLLLWIGGYLRFLTALAKARFRLPCHSTQKPANTGFCVELQSM